MVSAIRMPISYILEYQNIMSQMVSHPTHGQMHIIFFSKEATILLYSEYYPFLSPFLSCAFSVRQAVRTEHNKLYL